MKSKLRFLEKFYMTLVFIFLYAPIVVLIIFSFNESRTRGDWTGFSLKWYVKLLNDSYVLRAVYNTFIVAIIATIVSTVIGTLAAVGLMDYKKNARRILLSLNEIPVLNPDIVIAVSLMVLYKFINLPLGLFSLTLSHIAFTIPYVVLSIMPKIRMMDRNLPEAAMDLGATPFQTLYKVIIPEIKPGIISGAMLAFTLSIDDFVISFFTTGSGVNTISTTVFSMAKKGINPSMNALTTIMFAVTLILLVIVNLKKDKETV
ncbi:MAG: ABC transporter permease [Tissierellia bacterium]|nr:ABC transporter permease [Tissierellia bacterium]